MTVKMTVPVMLLVFWNTPTGTNADAIQWTVEDGGNGHWYERTYESNEINWHQARESALARGGDSVVFNSLEERIWVNDIFVDGQPYCAPASWAQRYTFWIGLYQDVNAADYSEPSGGWYWVDGTPLSNSTCAAPYHCAFSNGGNGPEHFGVMGDGGTGWIQDEAVDADIYCVRSALIEWSADCNGDGIVDYGQILDGTFEDIDGNGVPDCCDSGASCASSSENHVLRLNAWPDAAVIPHHDSIAPSEAMTIEFWIQVEGSNGDGRPITKRPGNSGCYTIDANRYGSTCVGTNSVFGSCNGTPWGEFSPEWTHLALTVDGSTGMATSYVDGVVVSVNDQESACSIAQGSWDLRFGNTPGYSTTQFIGCLDNIRVWNRALSRDEVRFWMLNDITTADAAMLPELGGSWDFEGGVQDATGLNHGWLEGSARIESQERPDPQACLGDLDGDGNVDGTDLARLLAFWGSPSDELPEADLNHDGSVGGQDLTMLLGNWGIDCP